jgi:hypothetical protein
MSEEHSGLSHDMPEYVPNWPARAKARVYKGTTLGGEPCWRWEHPCRYRGGVPNYGYPKDSQPEALAGALKHLENCL